MKKIAAIFIGVSCMFAVTGCSNDITLNTEENNMVSEYIAGVLLKHSYENQWEYQKLDAEKKKNAVNTSKNNSLITATQAPTQPVTQTQAATQATSAPSQTTAVSSSQSAVNETKAVTSQHEVLEGLRQVLGLNSGVTISYTQTVSGKKYPNEQYMASVPANNSCVVVAVELELTNTTSSDITLNTASSSAVIKLGVEGTAFLRTKTILKNDIMNLKSVTIPSGQSYTAAVVFQIPEIFAESLDTATLTVGSTNAVLGTMELKK